MKKYKLLIIISLLFPVLLLGSTNSFISGPNPTKTATGPNPSNNFNFYMTAVPRENPISGGSSYQFTVNDVVWDHITGSTIDEEFDISVSTLPAGSTGIFESATPGVATVDGSGVVTRVSDGTAKINLKVIPLQGAHLKKQISYPVERTTAVVNSFNSFVAGSLGKHIYDDIDARINGVTASDATTKLFSTQDEGSGTYVWNTDFWAYGVDWTPIVAWNSYSDCCPPGDAERRAGVLISPRHVILANHYTIPNGQTVRFIEQDGDIVTRTVSSQAQVGSTDIKILLLDSDVTAGIGFVKVLPSNYNDYLPSLFPTFDPGSATSTVSVPSVNLLGGSYIESDSDKQGYLRELSYLSLNYGTSYTTPTIADRLAFFGRNYYTGDSGNPSFLIINDEAVLISITSSFGGYGPSIADYATEINSVMTTLGGGYSLTTADLSAFNVY